ncbi:GFA family protein [Reinekea blandensis]|uniref:CENP-V/GFA domain-containing protein n=1 Tax=Reinekea blandensis MED297 TaxID=314283 RepID=A4BFL0_9GAMM|nr:hypothetical protein [Reinekea blandensis]EAR09105.1 hypothetical protein MED297_17223 [Reinekea sp. MED297] [Reinekea blandensis MED297]
MKSDQTSELSCRCGQVSLIVYQQPIISVECLCRDCQQAGRLFKTLPDAPAIMDNNNATRFELYRKDRVTWQLGEANLKEHRLTADSDTRRVIATCCNTPMFLEFTKGHWLSIYGALWAAETLPPLALRTMTKDAPASVSLPNDVPNPNTHNVAFFYRLLRAWAAMGFRSPKVKYVHGSLTLPPG